MMPLTHHWKGPKSGRRHAILHGHHHLHRVHLSAKSHSRHAHGRHRVESGSWTKLLRLHIGVTLGLWFGFLIIGYRRGVWLLALACFLVGSDLLVQLAVLFGSTTSILPQSTVAVHLSRSLCKGCQPREVSSSRPQFL